MAIDYNAVLQKAKQQLMNIPGVTAVGLTHSVATKVGNEYQIGVYVDNEKVAASLPGSIDGVPVVYRVSGKFQTKAIIKIKDGKNKPKTLQAETGKFRPIIGGISGGLSNSLLSVTGTLGCFVKDANGNTVILSNNHVLAWDIGTTSDTTYRGSVGDAILQPGEADNGTLNDKIATLTKSTNITKSGNIIDAAYATPTAVFNEPNACNLYVNKSIAPSVGLQMKKAGRTTDCVTGNVELASTSVTVSYPIFSTSGTTVTYNAVFDDVITVTNPQGLAVSKEGDSGSVWVTADTNNNAVGLNFAGNDTGTLSIACKATNVESVLGVTFGLDSIPSSCLTPFVALNL